MATDETPGLEYKPFRAALKSLWSEFRRCSYAFPPLYHEHFSWGGEDTFGNQSAPAVWKAFRDKYSECFDDDWEEWDGPHDVSYFGRFTGSPTGLHEFKSIAESAYIVLCEMDGSLPRDYGHNGWLKVIHDMAYENATPLLRSYFQWWQAAEAEDAGVDEDDVHLLASGQTEGGVRFPLYPFHFRLVHNVFTSSMAAIKSVLDSNGVLLIQEWFDMPPLLPSSAFEEQISDSQSEGDVIVSDEITDDFDLPTDRRVFVCKLRWHEERWELLFRAGGDIQREFFTEKILGFKYYHWLLEHEGQSITPFELEVKCGVQKFVVKDKMDFRKDPDSLDPQTLRAIDQEIDHQYEKKAAAKLHGDFDQMDKADDEIERLQTWRRQYRGKTKGQPKTPTIGSNAEKARRRVWNPMDLARKKIRAKLPDAANYLAKTVGYDGECHLGYFPHRWHEKRASGIE